MPVTSVYQDLARSGFVGSAKRDVLLEASRDLEYVVAIVGAFEEAGAAAAAEAHSCAQALIVDLVGNGFCSLATWSCGYGSAPVLLQPERAELEEIVARSCEADHASEHFLVTTPLGDEWVQRYMSLVGEL